jgi:hypothetical protein
MQSVSDEHPDPQLVPAHSYAPHDCWASAGQFPAPSQSAPTVARLLEQLAARQLVPEPA